MEHPIDEAIRKRPDIFTEAAKKFEGEAFEEALSRWARESPEAAAYEDSIGKEESPVPSTCTPFAKPAEFFRQELSNFLKGYWRNRLQSQPPPHRDRR